MQKFKKKSLQNIYKFVKKFLSSARPEFYLIVRVEIKHDAGAFYIVVIGGIVKLKGNAGEAFRLDYKLKLAAFGKYPLVFVYFGAHFRKGVALVHYKQKRLLSRLLLRNGQLLHLSELVQLFVQPFKLFVIFGENFEVIRKLMVAF